MVSIKKIHLRYIFFMGSILTLIGLMYTTKELKTYNTPKKNRSSLTILSRNSYTIDDEEEEDERGGEEIEKEEVEEKEKEEKEEEEEEDDEEDEEEEKEEEEEEEKEEGEGKKEELAISEDNKQMPVTAIAPRAWEKYPEETWRGLQLPVITVKPGGRLGNLMGEYASLYALGRAYNVTTRLNPELNFKLYRLFPNLSMQLVPGPFIEKYWTPMRKISLHNYAHLEAIAAGLLGPHLFLIHGWPFEIHLFNAYRKDILRELTFSPKIMKEVRHFLSEEVRRVNKQKNETPVLVGVHVRRTDYVEFIKKTFQGHVPGMTYFEKAMAYYKKKFPNVIFVVGSDDMAHVKKHFGGKSDVIFAPGSSREIDMAALASCNHSIISLGSYGFWTGYLAGGEVLYPNLTFAVPYRFSRDGYDLAKLDFFTPINEE